MTTQTVRRYQTAYNEIRTMAGEQAAALWFAIGGLSQAEIDRYVERMVPAVRGAQVATARLVAGYLSQMSMEHTGARFPYNVDPDAVTDLRGVAPTVVYARPGVEGRTARTEGKGLQEAMHLGQLRARTLAESDVALAQRAAVTRTMSADPRITGYRRTLTGDSCAYCAAAVTQRYRTDQLMPLHSNCVIGSTVVSGPRTLRATSRRYEGEAVTIRTASGNLLTVTPNHPVLTDRGWIPAGLLHEGDNVVCRRPSERVGQGVPDEDHVPARIEDRFRALRVRGLARVPLTAEDFHGDVPDSKINVVDVDRDLGYGLNTAIEHLGGELLLTNGGVATTALMRQGSLATLIPRNLTATDGVVRGRGLSRTLLGGHRCGAHPSGSTSPTDRHARRHEVPADDAPLYAEGVSEGKLGLTVEVAGGHLTRRQVDDPAVPRFDPAGAEFSGEGVGTYTCLGRSLHDRLAAEVEVDRVVFVSRIDLASCHVYNLHTTEGWFAAGGIIVSNCDCGVAAIYGTDDPGQVVNEELLADLKETGGPEYWKEKGWGVDENGTIRTRRDVPVLGDDGQPLRTPSGNIRRRMELGDPIRPTVRTHGELGPTLVDPRYSFTGPASIPA